MKKTYNRTIALGLAPLSKRADPPSDDQAYRSLSLRLSGDGQPTTLDSGNRSVEVVAATENPVSVFDYSRYETVDEVLLMAGVMLPASRQLPLLDSHSRYSSHAVIGSFRGMNVAGTDLIGRAHFSTTAEETWTKVEEGHLTDFSVGYRVVEATWIPDGETAVISGRTFNGPLKVVSKWKPVELSVCPIGADDQAKARADLPPGADNNQEARGEQQPPPHKEEPEMDKQLRAFLERRGLAKDATETEALAFMQRMEADDDKGADQRTAPEPALDPKQITASERSRIREIEAMGGHYNQSDLARSLIDSDATLDEARNQIMAADIKQRETSETPGHRTPVELGADEREKFRSAATSAVLLRTGIKDDKPAEGADELAGRTMVDLARMSLVRAGVSDNGRPLDVVGRALTTGDFPLILSGAANKSLAAGFELADETWRTWCGTGSVSNFLTNESVRPSETDDLDEVPESQEYKYGKQTEAKEEYKIATFGKLFAITRQALVNDDLSALSDTPSFHGEAAARKLGDIAYAVLTGNGVMGDGKALFDTAHGNILAPAAPGIASIAAGIEKMKLQKDMAGKRRLNISPVFLLAPVGLEGSSEVFFRSERFDDADKGATTVNPYAGTRFTRVYEPRLDDDSVSTWYLAAALGRTIKMFFLDGVQAPYMETRQGWSVDGIEYKVRIDAGAKAMDWRGLSRNA